MSTPQRPIQELHDWLGSRLELRRSERRYDIAFDLDVAGDITADVKAHEECAARCAYSAEQEDLEAIKLLEAAAADGLTAEDMPAITKAIRLVRSSANHDRAISEALA